MVDEVPTTYKNHTFWRKAAFEVPERECTILNEEEIRDLILENLMEQDDHVVINTLTQLLITYFLADDEGIGMDDTIVLNMSSTQGDFKVTIIREKPRGPRLVQ